MHTPQIPSYQNMKKRNILLIYLARYLYNTILKSIGIRGVSNARGTICLLWE